MCGLGSWEYIGAHMTIPRLEAFQRYWEHSPPVHLMVAAYFGIGVKAKTSQSSESDIDALMKMYPQTAPPK